MWLGTYERDYPRSRVLIAGLRELGVEVVEHHRPVWEDQRHKAGAFLRPGPLLLAGGRYVAAWAGLSREVTHDRDVDAVVAGYPAQPDAVPAWIVAKALRVPLIVDMMISLWDTLAGDRALAGRAAAAALAGVDRVTLAAADLVLADTAAGAGWLSARFGVPRERIAVVPVGAESEPFAPRPAPQGPPTALFYGKLAPLHGIGTVLEAARAPGVPPVRVIGDGQLGPWFAEELRRDPPPGLTWEPWVPYDRLGDELGAAAIALGVFGTSDKAARVVPNKVWQAMAADRAVVTADTRAVREQLADGRSALLVPPGDAPALADALRRLAADAALRERIAAAGHERWRSHGAPRAAASALRDALLPLTFRS